MSESKLEKAVDEYNNGKEYHSWKADIKSWKACAKYIYEEAQEKFPIKTVSINILREICEIDAPTPMPEILPGMIVRSDTGFAFGVVSVDREMVFGFSLGTDVNAFSAVCHFTRISIIQNKRGETIWTKKG